MSQLLRRNPTLWRSRQAVLLLSLIILGGIFASRSRAAELEQFALDTQGKQLVVKLQTDSETPATVEYGQKGAVIHLKNASLSPQMVKQGLPMVMDAQNRFIGRAVPGGDDGGVKVVIPNVRPDQVTVKVSQVRQLETVGSIAPMQTETSATAPESQFRAAASAARASLEPPAVVRPAAVKPTTAQTLSVAPRVASYPKSSRPTTSVALKPQVVTAKAPVKKAATRRLPKVVSLTPPKAITPEEQDVTLPRDITSAPQASSLSPTTASRSAAETSSATASGQYPADVSWFESEQLPAVAGNDYGVLAIPEQTQMVTPPEPASPGLFSGLTGFLDGISGNQFSRPYGLAFWALIAGVVLFGALGFVFLAIGAYLIRSMWLSARPASVAMPLAEEGYDYPASGYGGLSPNHSPPMVQKYLAPSSGGPASPFAAMRKSRLGAIAEPFTSQVAVASNSLRDRIKTKVNASFSGSSVPGVTSSSTQGLRSRLRTSSSSSSSQSAASKPSMVSGLVPLGGIKGGRAGVYAHSMADAAEPLTSEQPATMTDAVSSIMKWL